MKDFIIGYQVILQTCPVLAERCRLNLSWRHTCLQYTVIRWMRSTHDWAWAGQMPQINFRTRWPRYFITNCVVSSVYSIHPCDQELDEDPQMTKARGKSVTLIYKWVHWICRSFIAQKRIALQDRGEEFFWTQDLRGELQSHVLWVDGKIISWSNISM